MVAGALIVAMLAAKNVILYNFMIPIEMTLKEFPHEMQEQYGPRNYTRR